MLGMQPLVAQERTSEISPMNGRLKQSVCRWCFGKMSIHELARACADIGLGGIDLVDPKDWPVLKEHGLTCTMTPSHDLNNGINHRENHAECLTRLRSAIDATADAGYECVICFSGQRKGIDDDEGMKNCHDAVCEVIGLAEAKKITLCMELLNSKRDHKDYQCDRTSWGVDLCKKISSPRFKLLYDIYHMQVQEGNVIDTIRANSDYIAHYHTAGVPGRHEIDEHQELNYPAIFRAIADLKFDGWVAHEFLPTRDPVESLRHAFIATQV